jgi:hypothetical protein
MINYKKGDKIICYDMSGRSLSPSGLFLKKGEVYTCTNVSMRGSASLMNKDGERMGGFFGWRFRKYIIKLNNNIQVL